MTEKVLNINYYRQTTDMSCGAASAMMVCNAFEKLNSYSEGIELGIYAFLKGDIDGTTPSSLMNFLKGIGLNVTMFHNITKTNKYWIRFFKRYAMKMVKKTNSKAERSMLAMAEDFCDNTNRRVQKLSLNDYRKIIDEGKYICSTITINPDEGGTALHWVVINGYDETGFWVADPYFGYRHLSIANFQKLIDTAFGRLILAVSK